MSTSKPPMNPSHEREQALFILAAAKPAAERGAFLERECGGNKALRARLEALLAAHENPEPIMASPAAGGTVKIEFANVPDEIIGQKIGRYKILEKVGEGGCGVVYVAEQTEPVRRRVALKVIKLGMDTKQVVARFEAERQALAMMDHPNIAKVLDAGSTEMGRPYFVMELVRGIRLTDYCDQSKLSTNERLDLYIHICQAIQHAHQKGIIHRDIKPSNILVTLHDGVPVPKVIDFGIAKATEGRLADATVYTQLNQFIGTPAYMSPEQAEMSGLDIDTRSDIYSLGVLLYELLTGKTPFDAQELMSKGIDAMRKAIREQEPPKPSTRLATFKGEELTTTAKRRSVESSKLAKLLRGDLDWIVMKCLEKDRTRRYETANGLASDLKRHLANQPVVARPPSTIYELQKTIRRHKFGFAATATIMMVLVVGITFSTWQAKRATKALQELRATAPAMVEQAHSLAAMERFDEAIEKLDYALKLRPDTVEYIMAKGDLFRCQFKLREAVAAYRAALTLQPDNARVKSSLALCTGLLAAPTDKDGKLTRESLSKLHLAMQKEQRPATELMPVARLLGDTSKVLVEYWLTRLKDLPISGEKSLKDRLALREDGRLALNLSKTKVIDLAPLTGAPLGELNLADDADLVNLAPLSGMDLAKLDVSGTLVADLVPLRDMHGLKELNLSGTKVTDLSSLSAARIEELDLTGTKIFDLTPLRGMKLKKLALRDTRVSDLSPLAGMPLVELDATTIPAADYSPLAGAPLEQCVLQNSPVRDISFLKNSSVKELTLIECNEIRGYSVLNSLKSLDLLILPQSFRSLPQEDLDAIKALRHHPTLRNIQTEYRSGVWDINTAQSKDIFWQDWDREQAMIEPLRLKGIKFNLQKQPDSTYTLFIGQQPLRDLSALKDMPISKLWLRELPLTDLSALRSPTLSRSLKELNFWRISATDYSPVSACANLENFEAPDNPISSLEWARGLKLHTLRLNSTKVTDISPVAGMPLEKVILTYTQVTDLAPLLKCPTLQTLVLPSHPDDVTALRRLPALTALGNEEDNGATTPAVNFWKEWDVFANLRRNNINFSYSVSNDGTYALTLHKDPFSGDLSILKGMPVSGLNLSDCGHIDMETLPDLPLKSVNFINTSISDLRPLTRFALEHLDIRATVISDLTPLQTPPLRDSLKELLVWGSKVTDLSPIKACTNLEMLDPAGLPLDNLEIIRGLKLRSLTLENTKVTDISVLAGMPLENLMLGSTLITNLAPLSQCRTLQSIVLPGGVADSDVAPLRQLPALKAISYNSNTGKPTQSAAEFWREFGDGKLKSGDVSALAAKSIDDPGDSLLAMKVVALQLWFGQNTEYAASCQRLIELAEKSPDDKDARERAAKNWCLQPSGDDAMLQRVLALMKDAAMEDTSVVQYPWRQQTLGMAEFRAGHEAAAETAFLKAEQAVTPPNSRPDIQSFIVCPSRFFRAMILFRRGSKGNAVELFRKAEAEMRPVPANADKALPIHATQDNLLCWLSYKEAKALLKIDDSVNR